MTDLPLVHNLLFLLFNWFAYLSLGIAYILKLLDQNKDFDSLHWFESVKKRYEQDQLSVHNSTRNKSKEDAQTAQITLKKLAVHMQEFDLLKYPVFSLFSLSSSKFSLLIFSLRSYLINAGIHSLARVSSSRISKNHM
jgi:hypothetical protein